MSATVYNFKRYELKYMISRTHYEELLYQLRNHIVEDKFFKSSISNIYYDTPSYKLIRQSLEKPIYKEKFRIRSYSPYPKAEDEVFLELKKKYKKVVYKRRIKSTVKQSKTYLNNISLLKEEGQIGKEIEYFFNYYNFLKPAMYIYYDRYSYKGANDESLRITFDYNLKYRDFDLSLENGSYGLNLIDKEFMLMEIKISGAIPIWLNKIFVDLEIFQHSFSKYGEAYKKTIKESIYDNRIIV